jgi:cell division protease FtsH
MEEKLGHVAYEAERPLFLGIPDSMQRGRDFSEETAREIDCAVRKFVESAFDKAAGVLKQRQNLLERGAQLLLQQETLSEEDLKAFRSSPPGATDTDKVAK